MLLLHVNLCLHVRIITNTMIITHYVLKNVVYLILIWGYISVLCAREAMMHFQSAPQDHLC